MHRDTRFRFDPDRPDDASTRLLATLAALRAADQAVDALRAPLQQFLDQTTPLVRDAERTGSRVRLFFTGGRQKDQALQALGRLRAVLADHRVAELGQELDRAAAAVQPTAYAPEDLWRRYVDDAASVNAMLSTAVAEATHDEAEAARGFVPEELRQQVTAEPLDTTFLTATLRGYQVFGAQYAIHQQRAILGDEMGLGKTVQALAAVAHLAARDAAPFLVVCPASVADQLAARDPQAHSGLAAYSLHGPDRRPDRRGPGWRDGRRRGHHLRHAVPAAARRGLRRRRPCSWSTRRTTSRTRRGRGRGPWPPSSTGAAAGAVPDRHADGEPGRGVPQPGRPTSGPRSPPAWTPAHALAGARGVPPRGRAGVPAAQPGRRARASCPS